MRKNCFSFPVETVEGVFGETSDVLAGILRRVAGTDAPRVLFVADANVVQRTSGLGADIGRYVQRHGIQLADRPVVMPGGERIKSDGMKSAVEIASALLDARLGKGDLVLVLGGGTLLDAAGYAAAQVRGGVKVVRIPTTPAAMLDAAFSDYAAVDSATVKDAMRVPSAPAAVVIDPAFAATVLDAVWRGGIGEAARFAVAKDASMMKKLFSLGRGYAARDLDAMREIVYAACAARAKKGPTDFAEWGAFRLEAMSGWKLPHSYAVGIGICLDLGYAVERGLLKAADRDSVVSFLASCGALGGMEHSRHLLGQADSLLRGLDAWRLSTGSGSITLATGIGRSAEEDSPDREAYRKVLADMLSSPARG